MFRTSNTSTTVTGQCHTKTSEPLELDLVIVCASHNALLSDELASCILNVEDYGKIMTILQERIDHCMELSSKKKLG